MGYQVGSNLAVQRRWAGMPCAAAPARVSVIGLIPAANHTTLLKDLVPHMSAFSVHLSPHSISGAAQARVPTTPLT